MLEQQSTNFILCGKHLACLGPAASVIFKIAHFGPAAIMLKEKVRQGKACRVDTNVFLVPKIKQ